MPTKSRWPRGITKRMVIAPFPHKKCEDGHRDPYLERVPFDLPISHNKFLIYTLYVYDMYMIKSVYKLLHMYILNLKTTPLNIDFFTTILTFVLEYRNDTFSSNTNHHHFEKKGTTLNDHQNVTCAKSEPYIAFINIMLHLSVIECCLWVRLYKRLLITCIIAPLSYYH